MNLLQQCNQSEEWSSSSQHVRQFSFFFSIFAISFPNSLNKSRFASISRWSAGSEIKLYSLSCNVNREISFWSAASSVWPFLCQQKCSFDMFVQSKVLLKTEEEACERHATLIKDLCAWIHTLKCTLCLLYTDSDLHIFHSVATNWSGNTNYYFFFFHTNPWELQQKEITLAATN